MTGEEPSSAPRRARARASSGDWLWLGVGLSFVVAAAIFFQIAVLSFRETLPLNGSVGIRTSTTMASAEAWRRSHRAAAPLTLLQGVVLLAAAGWLLWQRPPRRRAEIGVGIAVALLLVALGAAVLVATNAATG